MNAISAVGEAASWRVDWAWSVPLIVATVVIHAFGLGFLHERVVRVVSRIIERRHFTPLFAVVMGVVVMFATILHAIEGGVWAVAYWLLGALPNFHSSVLFSLGAMTTYGGSSLNLKEHWLLMGALEALNGIILFGLTTAFLFSMIQEVWLAGGRERRRRH